MTPEERINRLEQSLGKNDELVVKLRDAQVATSEMMKEHAISIASHERWMAEHRTAMAEHKTAMKDLDERISRLVSGFGEFMRAGFRPAT